jgi:hypothetical protein
VEKLNDAYISKEEILKCIQKLKNEKACGEDEIINEYIKSTSNQFINIYEKLFNIIFFFKFYYLEKRKESENVIYS